MAKSFERSSILAPVIKFVPDVVTILSVSLNSKSIAHAEELFTDATNGSDKRIV